SAGRRRLVAKERLSRSLLSPLRIRNIRLRFCPRFVSQIRGARTSYSSVHGLVQRPRRYPRFHRHVVVFALKFHVRFVTLRNKDGPRTTELYKTGSADTRTEADFKTM